jgi:hypothetical protein
MSFAAFVEAKAFDFHDFTLSSSTKVVEDGLRAAALGQEEQDGHIACRTAIPNRTRMSEIVRET